MIELAGGAVAPKNVLVDYKSFKIMVRQGGKLCPVAVVGEYFFFEDIGVHTCCLDIFLFSETWRVETEEVFVTPNSMCVNLKASRQRHMGMGITVLGLPLTNVCFNKSIQFASAHCPVEFANCNLAWARCTSAVLLYIFPELGIHKNRG